jgi:hypothetical protein
MDALLRAFVTDRSAGRCEYCQLPQKFFTELFQIEHIVSRQHRGASIESNLAVACARCNLQKGPNIAGIDPQSEELVRLFNPRIDTWSDHFQHDSNGEIRGKTAIGRTTIYVLDMNDPRRVELLTAISGLLKNG